MFSLITRCPSILISWMSSNLHAMYILHHKSVLVYVNIFQNALKFFEPCQIFRPSVSGINISDIQRRGIRWLSHFVRQADSHGGLADPTHVGGLCPTEGGSSALPDIGEELPPRPTYGKGPTSSGDQLDEENVPDLEEGPTTTHVARVWQRRGLTGNWTCADIVYNGASLPVVAYNGVGHRIGVCRTTSKAPPRIPLRWLHG